MPHIEFCRLNDDCPDRWTKCRYYHTVTAEETNRWNNQSNKDIGLCMRYRCRNNQCIRYHLRNGDEYANFMVTYNLKFLKPDLFNHPEWIIRKRRRDDEEPTSSKRIKLEKENLETKLIEERQQLLDVHEKLLLEQKQSAQLQQQLTVCTEAAKLVAAENIAKAEEIQLLEKQLQERTAADEEAMKAAAAEKETAVSELKALTLQLKESEEKRNACLQQIKNCNEKNRKYETIFSQLKVAMGAL